MLAGRQTRPVRGRRNISQTAHLERPTERKETDTWPFLGLMRTPNANGAVVEVSSIIAMFVYALIAWAIVQLVWILFDRPRGATVVRETTVVDRTVPSQPQNQPRPQ